MDSFPLDKIQTLSSKILEEILNQLQVDAERFEDEINQIEQELLIRRLPYCRPVIDLV